MAGRVEALKLGLHPGVQQAFSELYTTVDAFLVSTKRSILPEDTKDSAFTRQAEAAILQHIHRYVAPPPVSGISLFKDVTNTARVLPTNCQSLDDLLMGGFREGQITELAGDCAVGKTQICLQCAAVTACREEAVLYIDTNTSFSATRVRDLCEASGAAQTQGGAEEALSRILVRRCHNSYSLLLTLQELETEQKARVAQGDYRGQVRLLIVDSISSLLSPILGGVHSQHGYSLMVQLATRVKLLARDLSLAVLLTNHTTTDRNGVSRPGLGETWRPQVHSRVLVTRQEGGGGMRRHRASLMASPLQPLGSSAFFSVGSQGLISGSV